MDHQGPDDQWQYQQPGYQGHQRPQARPWEQGQPWQPARYDPQLHRQRMASMPAQQQDWPHQRHGQPHETRQEWQQPPTPPYAWAPYGEYRPPQARRRKPRFRAPLYTRVAALAIAAGGAAYVLTGGGSPAKPLTCKQQYQQWKTGPAEALAKRTLMTDDDALKSAASSTDIPELDAALKRLGADATQLGQYPMPPCADPAGYWKQMMADIKAAGDNAGASSGLAGLMTAMGPLEKVKPLEAKLSAELTRTSPADLSAQPRRLRIQGRG